MVVDGDVDGLPANASAVALPLAVAGDAVADPVEATELLDVDVDHLARLVTLVAAHRHGWIKGIDPIQAQPLEDAADGGRRDRQFGSNLLAGAARPSQRFNLLNDGLRRGFAQPMRSRAAVVQASQALAPVALHPLANRLRADACGFADGLRRLPAQRLPHDPLSTTRVRRAFLCTFIRSSAKSLKPRQLQLPRSGPDEQPMESLQLEQLDEQLIQ